MHIFLLSILAHTMSHIHCILSHRYLHSTRSKMRGHCSPGMPSLTLLWPSHHSQPWHEPWLALTSTHSATHSLILPLPRSLPLSPSLSRCLSLPLRAPLTLISLLSPVPVPVPVPLSLSPSLPLSLPLLAYVSASIYRHAYCMRGGTHLAVCHD